MQETRRLSDTTTSEAVASGAAIITGDNDAFTAAAMGPFSAIALAAVVFAAGMVAFIGRCTSGHGASLVRHSLDVVSHNPASSRYVLTCLVDSWLAASHGLP